MSEAVANARAQAAIALQRIVGEGVSLRAGFAAFSTMLPDSRDRAFLSSLVHAGARWWLRYDAALAHLLEHPLRSRDDVVRSMIVLGLVQLEVLQLPAHAAVAATVDATRVLGKPKLAALVNAVLRRWLRERERLVALLDADAVTRLAHPAWLLDSIDKDWPEEVESIAAANNAQAPLWLRVNARRSSVAAMARQLADAGVEFTLPVGAGAAIQLARSTDVTQLPGYAEGWFSVQDGAAQWAAELLDARDGDRVLDACAAPGGKSAHLLERNDVKLLAIDSDARRLPRLQENLDRLGLVADVRQGDASQPQAWWDGAVFQRILIDAPCSASGIIRRQPDIKLHRRATDVPVLVRGQARMLDGLWPLLAGGGRLVYATCSILKDENARQIATFLARRSDARALNVAPSGWRTADGLGAQNLPGEGGMDGFFYAVLEKTN